MLWGSFTTINLFWLNLSCALQLSLSPQPDWLVGDFKLTRVFQFGMEGVICQTNCEGRMFRVWGWPEFGIHLNFFSCFGTHPKINNVQPYLYNNAEKPLKHVLSLVTSWGKRVVVCMALSRTDNQNNLFMFDRFSGSTDNLPQKFCQSLFSNYICHPPGFSSNWVGGEVCPFSSKVVHLFYLLFISSNSILPEMSTFVQPAREVRWER